MLKKENRITNNKDFLKIFKSARPLHTEHFTFRCTKRIIKNQPSVIKSSFLPRSCQNVAQHPNINNQTAKNLQYVAYNTPTRYGFVVSNKIDKRAVRRNGLKRRMRAIIREISLDIKNGNDVVIQTKKPFSYPYKYDLIRNELIEGLKKLDIFNSR